MEEEQRNPEQAAPPSNPSPPMAPLSSEKQLIVSALANDAAMHYKAKSYVKCIKVLQEVLDKRKGDPMVLVNKALAEFHNNGCISTAKLMDALDRAKEKCEELKRVADEQLEATGNISVTEHYDASIPILNMAILHYHRQDYDKAMDALKPLMENIEPVEEGPAFQVCLLALDITLGERQPGKAAAVIRYMEKSYGLVHTDVAGGNISTVPANGAASSEGRNLTVGINSSGGSASPLVNSPSAESSLTQSSVGEETLEEDAFIGSLVLDGNHRPPVLPPRSSPAPATELKLLMHLYKVRLLITTRQLKAAKREVKSALNLSKDNLTALLLKGHLEYLGRNYLKALKLLSTCDSHKKPAITPMIYNNLGCVYQAMHMNETSAVFFLKALKYYDEMMKERPVKLWTYSQDRSFVVWYNSGLQKLLSGDPDLATVSFEKAGALYKNKPIYWLRRAECCILALEKDLLSDAWPKRKGLQVVTVGAGKWRRFVLPSGSMNPTSKAAGSFPSMDKAKQYLRFAGHYWKLQAETPETPAEVKASDDGTPEFMTASGLLDSKLGTSIIDTSVCKYEAQLRDDNVQLYLCILAKYAFVELCRDNPNHALKLATELLEHPHCTEEYRYLGRIYAAEALCLLKKFGQAEELLRMNVKESIDKDDAGSRKTDGGSEVDNYAKFTDAKSRATLYVNLAAVHALQGDLEQASLCSRRAQNADPDNNLATLTTIYSDLAQGKCDDALQSLRSFKHLTTSSLSKV